MEIIGIVGGVGPYAGLDLARNIFNETIAGKDQEHLPVTLMSIPEKIEDRTEYLLGKTTTNPAYAVSKIILQLENAGCTVIGIPCNTMHAPEIFNVIKNELKKAGSHIRLINMIDEVVQFISHFYPEIHKIAVLSTTGTYKTGIYYHKLKAAGLEPIIHADELQAGIHKAVYDAEFGIKARSKNPSKKAKKILENGISRLKDQGAEGIILGCTEIPYALPYTFLYNIPLLNPTQILARSLIHHTYPDRLLKKYK